MLFLAFDAGCEQNAAFRLSRFYLSKYNARFLCSLNMKRFYASGVRNHPERVRHAPYFNLFHISDRINPHFSAAVGAKRRHSDRNSQRRAAGRTRYSDRRMNILRIEIRVHEILLIRKPDIGDTSGYQCGLTVISGIRCPPQNRTLLSRCRSPRR